MRILLFSIFLLSAALDSSALVLLPPISIDTKVQSGVLQVHRADCYPSTNVIDTRIFNPTSTHFEGDVQLTVVSANGQEELTKSIKLNPRQEERLAFDFGKGICKIASELRFKSLSKR